MAKYRILSMDGGGIRGLFTSVLLDRISAQFPALLPKVDLIAGTSTGGIIAILLAAGKPPSEVIDLYSKHAKEIFDDSWFDDIKDMGTAIGSDYDNKKLKKRLEGALGKTRLRDLQKKVLIPTFDLDAPADKDRPRMWNPKFFHNFPGPDSDGNEFAVDVALRTSAAPTYFPAYQGYVDGGVVANNPGMAALAQALDQQTGKQSLGDIALLSLGTGTEVKFIPQLNLDWGWTQWARPLVSMMIGGVMGVADYQCERLLRDRYLRIDRYFDQPVQMDNVKPENLAYLKAQATGVSPARTVHWLQTYWA
jgi:patatin-like phospholipase/acyl hydrolase